MKPETIAMLAGVGFTGLALDLLKENPPKPAPMPMPPPIPKATREAVRAAKMKGRDRR
jgi:hypothetical protein